MGTNRMRKLIFTNIVLLILLSLLPISDVFPWDNEVTHRDLSKYSADHSTLSKTNGDYLINLGFKLGLDEVFAWQGKIWTITKWLREGSFTEDAGSNIDAIKGKARFNNHFHNPLNEWSKAGLDDSTTIVIPSPPFVITYTSAGESALKWAQDKTNQESYAKLEGDQTWPTIRGYYYNALTGKTDLERQGYFARVFKGLGHQMHLIQDMAVPAHVRNDAHPEDSLLKKNYITGDMYFETWAKTKSPIINSFAANPMFPQVALNITPRDNLSPITQFYDTDQYKKNVVPTNSLTWGLSEYTNSNFVSSDTIFTENFSNNDGHYFPYPRYTDQIQCYEQFDRNIASNKKRTYWRKKENCSGEQIDHFVTMGPLFKYLPLWDLQRLSLRLDEATHNDYAEKLVPRAVGYSAALLNYFFRGDINLKYESGTDPGYVISNNSDENMSGTFQVFYDKRDNNRTELWSGTLSINAHGKSGRVDFQEPDPENAKEPGRYILVFRGTLGNEKDAVAGRVAGRLLEITPPSQYVYSIINGSIDPQQFKKIKAKIRNATGEEIQNGTLQAVAKYIKRIDYEPDLSADPPTTESREPDFSYSVSEQIPIPALSATEPAEFTFNFINSPIPAGITDLYLQVIFKGTIGDETDTASAIGIKDLAEPTHHVFWNLSDMFSLNGQLYTAEDIKNDSALASLVDFDHDGIFNETSIQEPYIDPVGTDLKIAYFGENPPAGPVTNVATVDKLPAGRNIRLVILLDRLTNNYLRLTWSDDIYPESYYDFVFSGAINQEVRLEVNGQEEIVFNYTPPTRFRASLDSDGVASIPISQHFSQGILSCLPRSSPRGCFYPEEEAIPANPEPLPVNILFP